MINFYLIVLEVMMSRSCRKVCYFAPMLCVKHFPEIIQLPVPSLHLASVSFIPQPCFVFIHLLFGCHQAPLSFPYFVSLILLGTQVLSCLLYQTNPNAFDTCSCMHDMPFTHSPGHKCLQVIKVAVDISASVFLSLSLYLGGCCCLQPLNELFAPRASIYLTPHITRGFFLFFVLFFFHKAIRPS